MFATNQRYKYVGLYIPRSLLIIVVEEIVDYPVPLSELTALRDSIGFTRTKKNLAFILGHGLWSDLDIHQSLRWVNVITATINTATDYGWYGLFITPNASGKKKSITMGNVARKSSSRAV